MVGQHLPSAEEEADQEEEGTIVIVEAVVAVAGKYFNYNENTWDVDYFLSFKVPAHAIVVAVPTAVEENPKKTVAVVREATANHPADKSLVHEALSVVPAVKFAFTQRWV